jgi:long-subunit acyl-CoA synthetase (AMP-forming)
MRAAWPPRPRPKRSPRTPDREAYRYPVGEDWRSMTWRQAGERVKAIAAGLLSLGLAREERVGILSNTRLDWLLCDLGILSAGGATTTVYPSSGAEECAFILADSETRFAFVEDASQLKKLVAHKAELPGLSKIILIDGARPTRVRRTGRSRSRTSRPRVPRTSRTIRKPSTMSSSRHQGRAPRHADLHLGHHRQAQGRAAAPRVLGLHRRRDGRDQADDRRRRAVPVAADVALASARC